MLRVKVEHVDLPNWRFQVLVKKGKGDYRWEWRSIEYNAMSYWQEITSEARVNEYLFSIGLKPGIKSIRSDQIKRRWERWGKVELGYTVGFYSLKSSHLEEIAKEEGIKVAQESAGHSTAKVTKMYATGEDNREHEIRVKRKIGL